MCGVVLKSIVRNNILDKLSALSPYEKKRQSVLIQNRLNKILKNESGPWAAYLNLSDEPEIQWDQVSSRIDWLFPRLNNENNENNENLEFRKSAVNFSRSALGFSEPQDGIPVDIKNIRGFLIPGLAFDKHGYRLGRGKGYYDRALAGYSGFKFGVCFETSLCDELPHEEHDIRCDQIVTANQIYTVNKSEGVRKWN